MRRASLIIVTCLATSSPIFAKDATPMPKVRPFSHSSTDVFDVLTRLMAAEADYKRGDFAAAFDGFRYAYLHDRSQEKAATGYANSALALGKVDLAHKLFNTMSHDEARTGQVLCAVIKGETAHPEAALRARLKTSAEDGRLWNALGRVLDERSRGSEARQTYAMAAMTGQRAGLAENNLGQSFLLENNLPRALENFQLATSRAPDDLRFDNNRRLTLLLQQNYTAALKSLPQDRASIILTDAGVIALRQDDRSLAKFLFEKAQTLSPVHDARLAAYLSELA